jgi:hypothetical protein
MKRSITHTTYGAVRKIWSAANLFILRNFAILVLYFGLSCGIALAFLVSAAATKVVVPPEPGPVPDIDAGCQGPWNGKAITQVELDAVIEMHRAFLARVPAPKLERSSPYTPVWGFAIDPSSTPRDRADALPPSVVGTPSPVDDKDRADLCGARIVGLSLKGADLRFARFMGARLENVDLSGVNASWSYWRRAGLKDVAKKGRVNLYGADLTGLIATNDDMSSWNFENTDLSFAIFGQVVFEGANLDAAILAGATFRDAIMKDATFYKAQFAHTRLEIRPGQLPVIPSLRDCTGLTSLLTLNGGEATLVEIREQLRKAGFDYQAQQVNYAINSFSEQNGFPGAKSLNYILFGISNAYGMKPQRPLATGLLLIPIFSLFYIAALFSRGQGRQTGIWLLRNPPRTNPKRIMRPVRLWSANCSPLLIGVWFSVLSAFRIGWHEFNVGDWIARIQQSDYRLEGGGWVKSIAGIQSLISVYLLALALAAYLNK